MSATNPRSASVASPAPSLGERAAAARAAQAARNPFLGLLDPVIVEGANGFVFDGCIAREHANSIWTWVTRDVAPDLLPPDAIEANTLPAETLEAVLPEVMARIRDAVAEASGTSQPDPRFKAQLGGEDSWGRLPVVLNAIKIRTLLTKAAAFGRASNSITDDAAMATALQSMPLQDPTVAALLMHAVVGQVITPSRLVTAVIRVAGPSEAAIQRSGFGPLIDAILAHAQNQTPNLQPMGAFADIDLVCRAIDRFHKLIRSINSYIELGRSTRWSGIVAALIKTVSERIEPRLKEVPGNLNQSMRKHREGMDRVDSDELLAALNGFYLLATVRDCRDSLALNAVFDQAWGQTGQALEIHLTRNLDNYRANPTDRITAERLEAGIKMAELRFNPEYAEVLRRAMETASRRGTAG